MVPSWCQCTTCVPANTLLLIPLCAQTRASTALPLRCHCRPELGMCFLPLIYPQPRWAVAAGSSIVLGGGFVPMLGWLMHGKGKMSRAGDGSEPTAQSACVERERPQGCRSSPKPLPQQSCSKTLCFGFTLLTQCPGFHWAESFIYLNGQAVDLNSCS